uniref:Uncharacterized protein n=1 Tax=Taiwanofungus camphoratus TaxID=2696576 RepID=A0A4D6SWA2_TAICA|nr:hypothetical protein [Taiwanofungus camphoratus]QCG70000.1 hypothetical protein [Taiwanofungus camphoratus]
MRKGTSLSNKILSILSYGIGIYGLYLTYSGQDAENFNQYNDTQKALLQNQKDILQSQNEKFAKLMEQHGDKIEDVREFQTQYQITQNSFDNLQAKIQKQNELHNSLLEATKNCNDENVSRVLSECKKMEIAYTTYFKLLVLILMV